MTFRGSLTCLLTAMAVFAALAIGAGIARADDHVPHQVILQFAPGASAPAKEALRAELGVQDAQGLGGQNLVVYTTSSDVSVQQAIATAEESGLVEEALPNGIGQTASEPNDPYFQAHDQWALKNSTWVGDDIGATRAWDVTTGSPSVVVAVVDSGITFSDTQDFSGRIWANSGEIPGNGKDDDDDSFVDDVNGWDFVNGDNNPTDDFGHGTAMSGIIGAAGDDGLGMTGVDQDATLMPLKAANASGSLNSSNVALAINYAANHGAAIVNMSFAGDASFGSGIETAIANHPNILFVAAAGNNGGAAQYPCSLPETNILCVASTNSDDTLSGFSNYSNSSVDIGAPGSQILEPSMGGGYQYGSGTSEATAVTSGAAALLASAHPSFTGVQLKQRIMATVDPDSYLVGKTVTGGRLDIGNALDYTAPDTTITAEPASDGSDSTPSFSFTSNESSVSYQCSLDGAAFAPCASPVAEPTLADGSHTFEVEATDRGLNTDPTPASYPFTIDTVAPETTITSAPAKELKSSSASISFNSSESATYLCSLDGGAFTSCSSPADYNGLADGNHSFEVKSVDGAGNVDATPATATWLIDTHPPVTSITSKLASMTDQTSASIVFAADETDVTYQCKLDSSAWASCSSPANFSGLPDGSHTFSVRATDSAGNVEAAPPSYAWTIDTTPPETALTSGPASRSNATSVSFTYSSEANASFQCSLDNAAFATCPATGMTYTGLADGSHTFSVRAVDAAGNIDATPASQTFVLDRTGPVVALTSAPPASSESTAAGFSFTSEADASFQCSLDGSGFSPCQSGIAYGGLTVGNHTFAVRALDDLGNPGVPVAYGFTVAAPYVAPPPPSPVPSPTPTPDPGPRTTHPSTQLLQRPPVNARSGKVTFKFGGGRTYRYKIDGKAWVTITKAKLTLNLKSGAHVIRAIAMIGSDADQTPLVYRFKVDS